MINDVRMISNKHLVQATTKPLLHIFVSKMPKYSFGAQYKAKIDIKSKTFVPGPGQYNPSPPKVSKAFTMGSKNESYKTLNSSGSLSTGDDSFFK